MSDETSITMPEPKCAECNTRIPPGEGIVGGSVTERETFCSRACKRIYMNTMDSFEFAQRFSNGINYE